VDFYHCGRRGARDRAYRTISPSSDTQTTGASTDKISHPRSMRSSGTFPSPSWSIDRERSGRDKYDCNRYSVPYQEIYHRLLPIHQPERYLCEWGKAVTGVTGMREYAHAGNGFAQLGYKVNAGWAGRANNCGFHHDKRGSIGRRCVAVRP
jgi:hypothetical protein